MITLYLSSSSSCIPILSAHAAPPFSLSLSLYLSISLSPSLSVLLSFTPLISLIFMTGDIYGYNNSVLCSSPIHLREFATQKHWNVSILIEKYIPGAFQPQFRVNQDLYLPKIFSA